MKKIMTQQEILLDKIKLALSIGGLPFDFIMWKELIQKAINEFAIDYEINVWKKYPENKPEKSGKYLIQIETDELFTRNYWVDQFEFENIDKIVAWRELPKYYQID